MNIFLKSNRKITNENYTEIWRRQTLCPHKVRIKSIKEAIETNRKISIMGWG
jgi:hypothetical protein